MVIKIRYANFDTETKQCKIAYTSADHMLTKTVNDLFDKVYQRRMRLHLIGIRFSGLVRSTYQINLFEDIEEMLSLYQAMDRMKSRYGFDAVMRCKGEYFDTAHFTNSLEKYPFQGGGCYLLLGNVEVDYHFPTVTITKMAKMPFIPDPRYSNTSDRQYKVH